NCPFCEPEIVLAVGIASEVDTSARVAIGARVIGIPPDGTIVGTDGTMVPPVSVSNVVMVPFPACEDCSAIQGCWVIGFKLIILGSAPTLGIRHSWKVLLPRRTPTKLSLLPPSATP